MSSKKKWILPITFLTILLVWMTIVFVDSSKNKTISIFSDIKECEQFSKYEIDGSLQDKYLKGLAFEKSYVAEVKYESAKFKIFAYEFKTADDAKEYCSNYSERTVDGEFYYNFSSGMLKSEGIVLNGKNLYRIECSSLDTDEVKDCLSSAFSLSYANGTEGFVQKNQ